MPTLRWQLVACYLLIGCSLLFACSRPQSVATSETPAQTSVLISPTLTAPPNLAAPLPKTPLSEVEPASPPVAESGPGLPEISSLPPNSGIKRIDRLVAWGELFAPQSVDAAAPPSALLRTQDGGLTWYVVSPPAGYPGGSRYFALDANTAWAIPSVSEPGQSVKEGFVYFTPDAGLNWTRSEPLPTLAGEAGEGEFFVPSAVFFLDKTRGWLGISVGRYMNQDVLVLFLTRDGGYTWRKLSDKLTTVGPVGFPCQMVGLAFTGPLEGWMAGNCLPVLLDERWTVRHTTDAGVTWLSYSLPPPQEAPAAVLTDQVACSSTGVRLSRSSGAEKPSLVLDYSCIVVTDAGNTPTFAFSYVSTDDGKTWIGAQVTSASFYIPQQGIALGPQAQNGNRSLFITIDGGATWEKGFSVTWPEAQLDFISAGDGWSLASRWNPNFQAKEYALVKTTDGGATWRQFPP